MNPDDIPVIINSFNQVTYLDLMVRQLRRVRCRNIIVIDQASTYPPLLAYLDALEPSATIIRLRENHGPHWIFTSGFSALLPELFVYTDPDILFPAGMPRTLLSDMARLTRVLKASKVGLALDISQADNLKHAAISIGGEIYTIDGWEAKFWKQRIRYRNFEIYKAPVDTTFSMYNRRWFNRELANSVIDSEYFCMDSKSSYRLAGHYTSVHLPWMLDDPIPQEELQFYIDTRKVIHNY